MNLHILTCAPQGKTFHQVEENYSSPQKIYLPPAERGEETIVSTRLAKQISNCLTRILKVEQSVLQKAHTAN